MLLHLKPWLTPPVFPDDEEQTRRASVLNVTLLTALALVAIILVGGILGGRTPPFVLGTDVIIIILCLIFRGWMHQGRIRLASAALIGMAVVCTTVLVAMLGTIRVPTAAFYLLIVVVGGLLFDVEGIVVTTVLSSLAVLGLIMAENGGLLPRPDYTVTITQWITYTALAGFSGGLTFVALQSTRRALQRADREIAERRRTEEVLRESEARYRRLIEGSPDIVYVFSDQRGGLYYSSSTESTLGYSSAYLCAHPFLWNESIHADDRPRVTRAIQEFAAGQEFDFEYRIRDAHGKWRWLRDRSIGRRIENGESFIEGLAMDITDRKQAEEAVRASEQKFRSFVEQSSEGFTLIDEDGAILEWNRAREQMTGLTRDQVLGRPWWDVQGETLPPEERNAELYQRRRQMVQDALRTGESSLFGRTIEAHTLRLDGEHRFSQQTIFPIKTDRGYRLGTVSRDVTEQRRAAEALQQSEALYHTLVETLPLNIFRKDAAGRFTFANTRYCRTQGWPLAEILGKTDYDLHPPEMAAQYRADDERIMASGETLETIEAHQPIDGPITYVQVIKTPLFAASGKVIGIQGAFWDVTERRQMEESLRQANGTLQALIDHSPLAIILLNQTGDVVLWSQAAETLYGWTADEVLGKPLPTVSVEKWEEYQAIRARINQGEVIAYTEVTRRRKDGSDVFLGLAVAPLKDSAGNVYAQMSVAADITERKRAEEALRALNAELEQRVAERTRALTDVNARLTELDRLKDEFISRISHELRTPLMNIKIYLELVEHGKPEKRAQYMQTLHAETGKLQQRIDDLLEVSNLQTTRLEPQLARCDVNRLVQEMVTDQLPQALARGVSLTLTTVAASPGVTTDRALVWQVLSRLLANALAYTPHGGAVTLRTERRAGSDQAWLTIEVRDTGPGIAEKDLPYLFEPFYRGAAADNYKTPGTGVGLSIARRMIEQLGGRLTVDSQPGQGAAFTIWLCAD